MISRLKSLLNQSNKELVISELMNILKELSENIHYKNMDLIEAEYQYPENYDMCQKILNDEIELYFMVSECKNEILAMDTTKNTDGLMRLRLKILLHNIETKEKDILRGL